MNNNHKTPPLENSVRSFIKALKKLNVRDGDCLLLKSSTALAKKEVIDDMLAKLSALGYAHLVVIVVDDFDDLKDANELEMNKNGWFRVDALRKIVHRAPDRVENRETAP